MDEIMIKQLPKDERPRERMLQYGPTALSNTELLAIILRTGTKKSSAINLAKAILQQTEGIENLNMVTIEELTKIEGIGPGKATQIIASIEIGKRLSHSLQTKENKKKILRTPKDCYDLLVNDMKHLKQEHFVVLSLDSKRKLIGKDTVFVGSLDKSVAHPREIFLAAVKRSAATIIVAHNHPSGDVTPSEEDILLTRHLMESSLMMDIPLEDHLIIGNNDYSSLKAYGYC